MKLHWSPRSPFVRKVMICAHELGVTSELELVRTVTAMLKPNETLMRENPLSKIPTLVLEDGTILYDSVVICEYLNEHAKGSLFPAQGPAKWRALRWHALGTGLLDAVILWRNERERQVPLPALLDGFELKTRTAVRQLDGEADDLARAPFSIGQIAIGCALGYLDFRFKDIDWRADAPRLAAWMAETNRRPSFVANEAREG